MAVVGEFVVACPGCGKRLTVPPAMAGKRAKCSCGQALIVPMTPGGVAVAAPARTATVAPGVAGLAGHGAGGSGTVPIGYRGPGAPKSGDPARAQEQSAVIRQAVLFTVLLAVVVGGVFALRHFGKSMGGGSAATAALGEDALVEEMISDEGGMEAKEWLAERPGRMLSGMTTSQAESRIQRWYEMGAVKVYAFGGMATMNIALELPADPPKRKAMFDWVNEWHGPMRPAMKDVGQKYLLVRLRI